MPEIPLFNGSQVLNPSSPVPALSGANAGEELGNMVATFGKNANALGQDMLAAAKRAKNDADTLQAAIIEDRLRKEFIDIRQKIAAQAVDPNDADGSKAAQQFEEEANKRISSYTEMFGDPMMKARITKGAGNHFNEMYSTVYTNEIAKIEKNRADLEQKWLGSKLSDLESNPQNIGRAMAQAEIHIGESSYIPEAQKPQALYDMQLSMASSMAQSFINRGNLNNTNPGADFDRGLKMVGTLAPKLKPADLKKLQDDIIEKKNFRLTSVNAQFRFEEDVKKRNLEDMRNRQEMVYLQAIRENGADERATGAVLDQAMLNPIYMGDPETIKRLQTFRTYNSSRADDNKEAEFNYKVAQGASAASMIKYVKSLYSPDGSVAQKVSAEKAADLMNKALHLKDTESNTPQLSLLRKNVLDYIEKMAVTRYSTDVETQRALRRGAVNYLQTEIDMSRGQKVTPEIIIRSANRVIEAATGIENDIDVHTDLSALQVPPKQRNNLEKMDKDTKADAKEYITNRSSWSDERKRAYLEELKAKNKRRKKLPEVRPGEAAKAAAPEGPQFKVFER